MATAGLRKSEKVSICHFQPLSREVDFVSRQGKGELGKQPMVFDTNASQWWEIFVIT